MTLVVNMIVMHTLVVTSSQIFENALTCNPRAHMNSEIIMADLLVVNKMAGSFTDLIS